MKKNPSTESHSPLASSIGNWHARLTLLQKALLYISIPMILQVGFLAFYANLLERWQGLADHEYHSKEIIGRTNWLSCLLLTSELTGLAYTQSHNREDLASYQSVKQAVSAEFEQLAPLVVQYAELKDYLEQAKQLTTRLFERMDNRITQDSGTWLQALADPRDRRDWHELFGLRKSMMNVENTAFKSDFRTQRSTTNQLRILIFVLMLLVVASGGWLLFVFTRQITSRLSVMNDNIKRLSSRETLNSPVHGWDEVAQVDSAFHDMAERLSLAEAKKQEYISMISHDLRTPLTNAVMGLELMSAPKYAALTDRGSQLLQKIDTNLHRLLALIDEFLELEKMEGGAMVLHISHVSLDEMFSAARDSVQELAAMSNIAIMMPPQTSVSLMCDKARIVRVLVNLLGNAIKFSAPGGAVNLTYLLLDGSLEIHVADQGRGIPPEFAGKIFERFQQVRATDEAEAGGTGLGLTICKAIVENHGGSIGVESVVGDGSTFWFRLPLPAARHSANGDDL